MEKTISQRVIEIIVELSSVNEEDVVPEASFSDDLRVDSLDQVELIMAFEDRFGLTISDEDAEKIKTVQDAIDYISGRIGQES